MNHPGRARRWLQRSWRVLRWPLLVGLLSFAGLLLAVGDRVQLEAPTATSWVVDRGGVFLGEAVAHPDDPRGWWTIEHLPHRLVSATLAAEDRHFYSHPGVDPRGVARAVLQNLKAGRRVSGASTLAMQVARLQRPAQRNWLAKIAESGTALRLVWRYGRREVLRHFLRIAPYGPAVRGAAYAARRYFDKPVADLSWAEVAFLAALPQAPSRMNPATERGLRRARARAQRILNVMARHGHLNGAQLAQARLDLAALAPRTRPLSVAAARHAVRALDRGGYVESTLEVNTLKGAQRHLGRSLAAWRDRGAGNGAVLVVDRADWTVRAAVGSADWRDAKNAGAVDFSRALRLAGSTYKPFFYAAALDQGLIEPGAPLDDLARARDPIGNSDGRYLGPLLPRQALATSRNVPALEVVNRLGVDGALTLVKTLGLNANPPPAEVVGGAVAIGVVPTTLVDLVTAYGTLARDGRLAPLRWTQDAPATRGQPIFTPQTAQLVQRWLSDPLARMPVFPRSKQTPYPVAIKTGTTANWRDGWAVLWTPRYVVGVWSGRPDATPTRGISGHRVSRVARDVLDELHFGEVATSQFPAPQDWQAHTVCALSGQRPNEACDRTTREWFAPDHGPHETCTHHVRDAQGRVALALPGRYAGWLAKLGLPTAPRLGPAREPTVALLFPRPGVVVIRDPENPNPLLTLRAAVDPPSEQLIWSVDGVPVGLTDAPHHLDWAMRPGAHRVEATLARNGVSTGVVEVVVR